MRTLLTVVFTFVLVASLSAESLWNSKRNGQRSMFADRVATNIGDILLVQVDESQVVSRSSNKSMSKNSSVSREIGDFLYPSESTGFGKHNGALPSLNLGPSNDSFSGEGSFSDTNTLEAKIAVLIVDVLPNGNLVVEGARKTEAQGETQYVVMRGIVRGDDVMPNNSVMSYHILNANVEILGNGDLANAQKKTWVNRLVDAVNVF